MILRVCCSVSLFIYNYRPGLLNVHPIEFNTHGVKKGKAEHLYNALHGIQTTLKCSGMDHTAFNLQRTPCQPLPRKRSPDGASTECGGVHLIAAHCSFIDSERMKGLVGLVD